MQIRFPDFQSGQSYTLIRMERTFHLREVQNFFNPSTKKPRCASFVCRANDVLKRNTGLPFYYRKLAGNIPDVKTIHELVRELDVLGYEKIKLVMDRGFYSVDNINALYKEHYKFIVGTSTVLTYAKEYIREISDRKDSYEFYNEDYELYVFTKTIAWDYEQKRPYKGDVIKGDRRMYLHLYYNPDK